MSNAATSVRWSFVGLAAKAAAQTVAGLVFARLLGPQAFGVIGLGTVYVALMTLLLTQGMGQALVRAASPAADDFGTVHVFSLSLAAVLAAVTFATAGWLEAFFDADGLALLLWVLAPGLLLKASSVTPTARLMRGMRFARLGSAEVWSSLVGAATGLIATALGAGLLGYAILVVTSDFVLVLILWVSTGIPPVRASGRALRALLGFTGRVSATQMTGFVARNADNLLIGKALGDVALGYYMLAYRIMRLPITGLVMVVNRALFPVFSSYADDLPRLSRNFLAASRTLAFLALPTMALVAVDAHELVTVVFGARWSPAVAATQVLAVAAMFQSLTAMMTPALLATGHEKAQLHWTLASTVTMLAAFAVTAWHGIFAVATAYAVVNAVFFPPAIRMLGRAMHFSGWDYLRAVAPAVVTASATAACALVARLWLTGTGRDPAVTLVVSGLAGIFGGLLIALVLIRPQITEQARLLRQLVAAR